MPILLVNSTHWLTAQSRPSLTSLVPGKPPLPPGLLFGRLPDGADPLLEIDVVSDNLSWANFFVIIAEHILKLIQKLSHTGLLCRAFTMAKGLFIQPFKMGRYGDTL